MIFSLIFLVLTLVSCNDKEIISLKKEIHELRTELREVEKIKYDLDQIKKDISSKDAVPSDTLNTENNTNSAIIKKDFKSNKSELDDPFIGSKDSKTILIMYTDHQCKLCTNFINLNLEKIKAEYINNNKIKFILRDHPLSANSQSFALANFTNCAGEQGKYWEALNVITSNNETKDISDFKKLSSSIKGINKDKLLRCINRSRYEKEIELDREDAKSLGVTGVPSFYVGKIDNDQYAGYLIRGAQPYNIIKKQIDNILK